MLVSYQPVTCLPNCTFINVYLDSLKWTSNQKPHTSNPSYPDWEAKKYQKKTKTKLNKKPPKLRAAEIKALVPLKEAPLPCLHQGTAVTSCRLSDRTQCWSKCQWEGENSRASPSLGGVMLGKHIARNIWIDGGNHSWKEWWLLLWKVQSRQMLHTPFLSWKWRILGITVELKTWRYIKKKEGVPALADAFQ